MKKSLKEKGVVRGGERLRNVTFGFRRESDVVVHGLAPGDEHQGDGMVMVPLVPVNRRGH